jgi:hypothetical protein
MSPAIHTVSSSHALLLAHGRRYVWSEGADVLPGFAKQHERRRDALGALFTHTVLPGLVRRGAQRQVTGAGPRGGQNRAHWITWRCEGDIQVVWALYVATRPLSSEALSSVGRPANDGALLAAWGDGPAMAWVSDLPALRGALRDALRALPTFLIDGVTSGDPTMPLRIRRCL